MGRFSLVQSLRVLFVFTLAAVLGGCGGGTAGTATGSTVTTRGLVVSNNGSALSNIDVSALTALNEPLSSTVTDEEGYFELSAVSEKGEITLLLEGTLDAKEFSHIVSTSVPEDTPQIDVVITVSPDRADIIFSDIGKTKKESEEKGSQSNSSDEPQLAEPNLPEKDKKKNGSKPLPDPDEGEGDDGDDEEENEEVISSEDNTPFSSELPPEDPGLGDAFEPEQASEEDNGYLIPDPDQDESAKGAEEESEADEIVEEKDKIFQGGRSL